MFKIVVSLPGCTNKTSWGMAYVLCLTCTLSFDPYAVGANNTASYLQEGQSNQGAVPKQGDRQKSNIFQQGQDTGSGRSVWCVRGGQTYEGQDVQEVLDALP